MGIPQIIVIVLIGFNLGLNLAMHGKKNEGKYNFFTALFSNVI